jgi:hypothetical protein
MCLFLNKSHIPSLPQNTVNRLRAQNNLYLTYTVAVVMVKERHKEQGSTLSTRKGLLKEFVETLL